RTTGGIGQALAAALAAGTGAFLVREQTLSGESAASAMPGCALEPHWPTALGSAYARMALGRWRPAAPIAQLQRGAVTRASGACSRVSLLATI
ncbi:MAG: hypothetical protein IT480_05645, partial [Gammaproteobacteria bacterium]|nr:hypothetical protein [Gammaproteobacteria bacterium]